MATKARQQYFADELSLQKQSREFSIADDIQQKIDSVESGAQENVIEIVKVNGTALTPDANKAVDVEVPEVIDNLSSTSADDALSAKQGKILYDYIQNIASRGRFLSNWNCTTGLPVTNPTTSPYTYMAGDYYSVSNVATGGGANYRPDGSSYTIGQASTTVETEVVNVSDFYLYDGTNWLLLVNTERQIAVDSSLSTTSTNPVENRVITNAINGKQNTLTAGSHISIVSDTISTTGLQGELTAGENITIEDICTTESDMKGPCPKGFHVGTLTEWETLGGYLTTFNVDSTYYKMPISGGYKIGGQIQSNFININDGCYFWTATGYDNTRARLAITNTGISNYSLSINSGANVRPFKNTPVVPDSSWTTLYDGSSISAGAGIFWNSSEGLISVSVDGTNWTTIADKSIGATQVYNSGDTLTEENTGYIYQWGNNYGFTGRGKAWAEQTTNNARDLTGYGPGNYYYSNIASNAWSNPINYNARGGVTQGTFQDCIYNVISATASGGEWGQITGTLTDQTDLISYVDGHDTVVSAAAPSNPTEGMVWYDTTNDSLKAYNGTSWETEGTKMVVLEYGVSTRQDFLDAYNKNAIVYCKVSSGSSGYRMAFMAYTAGQGTPTEVEFQYYRSRSSHSTAANQLDEVYVYKLTSAGVWTTTQRDTAAKPIAGTGIGLTYNSSGMTISADTTVLATQTDLTSKADASDVNTKTFPMAFATKVADAQAAIDWVLDGNNALIDYDNRIYLLDKIENGVYYFRGINYIHNTTNDTMVITNIEVTVVSGTVTEVHIMGENHGFLETNRNYSTPFVPTQAGHPATKKYVDDSIVTYTAGEGIEIKNGDDYSAMRGPAPKGYHIPTANEWGALCGILTTTFSMAQDATTMETYLKLPMTGYRSYNDTNVYDVGTYGNYWSSTSYSSDSAYYLLFNSSYIFPQSYDYRVNGFAVRCFKDAPVMPTSSWTTLYDGSSVATGAGVFYNATDGLISVSGDGQTWYTIMDKNLGATTVFNQGDTETDANCGYFYQWGNNYGFAHSGAVTTSSTQVDASNYGPGNYYSSDTFIIGSNDWSSVQNDNLWGGVTGVVTLTNAITNTAMPTVISSDGTIYYIAVSNSDPASGTASNIITLVP